MTDEQPIAGPVHALSDARFFLTSLPRHLLAVFTGRNVWWHLTAIALTAVTVLSGFDWFYFEHTRFIPGVAYFPAVVVGGLLPIIVPVGLLILGRWRRDHRATILGLALAQAAILALVITSAYKSVTGRVQPTLVGIVEIDNSRDFNFGFLEHGIFWGWPSGHTTTAFAMAVTLVALRLGGKRVAVAALGYSLYVGLSISVSIHWFSEFVAGAIFGSVIGVVVGTAFRSRLAQG